MISLRKFCLFRLSNLCLRRQLIWNGGRTSIITCERSNSWINSVKEADDTGTGALVKEFPRPKENLHVILSEVALKLQKSECQPKFTLQRITAGVATPIWKVHLSVNWPEHFVVEAEASKRVEAEKIAALLACKKIKEYGVLDGKLKPIVEAVPKADADSKLAIGNIFGLVAQKFGSKHWRPQYVSQPVKVPGTSQKMGWTTTLSMKWPQNHSVEGMGMKKLDAESAAATKALEWLREQGALDRKGFPVLYSREEKQEFVESRRAPVPIAIPPDVRPLLKDVLQNYQLLKPSLDEVNESPIFEEEDELKINVQPPPNQERRNGELFNKYRMRMDNRNDEAMEILQKQRALPISEKREEIMKLINQNQVVVLSGETGCGKTTQVPQYILDQQIQLMKGSTCNIVVTQPRRISAISIAHRIAEERLEQIGDTVGYQVRLQSQFPRGSGSILFCSTGVLLQRLHSDPNLERVSHVIVDEIHEKEVHTDFLLTLLKNIVCTNPRLKVVLMSATIDAELFSNYFNKCPIITVPGFMYPVTEHFLPEIAETLRVRPRAPNLSFPSVDYELVVKLVRHIDRTQRPGAILCFLPGWNDIKQVLEKLEYVFGNRSSNYLILPVHSSLPPNEQRLIFNRPKHGVRKIVLATNIAETAITIDDVVYVVDTGCHKETSFDAERGVSSLQSQWISKANAKQRKGRAGRVQPGYCYRLYDKNTFQRFREYALPEILRSPLEKIALDCKVYCPDVSVAEFLSQAPQPPNTEAIEKAVFDLQQLKILDDAEKLTPLGRIVSNFSTHPRLAVAIITAAFLRCLQPVVTVAAVLSGTRSPFVVNMDTCEEVKKIKQEYDEERYSDHLSMVGLFSDWENTTYDKNRNYSFCTRHKLHYEGMKFIRGLHKLIYQDLIEVKLADDDCDTSGRCQSLLRDDEEDESPFDRNSYAGSSGMALSALCTALYPNVIRIYRGDMGKCTIDADATVPMTLYGMKVAISKESVASKEKDLPSPWLIYFHAMKSLERDKILVKSVSSVPSLLLFISVDQESTAVNAKDGICLTVGDEARMKFLCTPEDAQLLKNLRLCYSDLFSYFLAKSSNPELADLSVEKLTDKLLLVLDKLFGVQDKFLDTKNGHTY